jgi:hypothetical protein
VIIRTFKYRKTIFIAKPLFEEVAMKTKELELSETRDDVASKVAETADYHPELDAAEILEVLDCSPEYIKSLLKTTTQDATRPFAYFQRSIHISWY